MVKNLISDPILARLAQIWAPKLLLWVLPALDVRYCRKLSLYTISEKTNDPILRKISDGQMDGWMDGRTDRPTDGQTDQKDFRERCRTNVECPT